MRIESYATKRREWIMNNKSEKRGGREKSGRNHKLEWEKQGGKWGQKWNNWGLGMGLVGFIT